MYILLAGKGYTVTAKLDELCTKTSFVLISKAGFKETDSQNIFIAEEALKYQMNVK